MASLKRLLVGSPIRTARLAHERLTKKTALAIFASDALSSTAYATEQILLVLAASYVAGQSGAFGRVVPISIAIGALLVIVAISYRQTIYAYPSGGGAFIVAKENLGTMPGLIAGASLLVDYILTVSVSTAAGVEAITSALVGTRFAGLHEHRVVLCLFFIVFIMVANLRGVREAGALFAAPSYAFIFSFLALIGYGLIRYYLNPAIVPVPNDVDLKIAEGYHAQPLSMLLLLGAFANGCAALTAAILILAANTSFAGFPRLASLLAQDRFLPRQLANLGDRLVFSNGIVLLAIFSGLLVWAFRGDTSRLIPLYAVGVFLSFTLSQAGMVVHWWREGKGLRAMRAAANAGDNVVAAQLAARKSHWRKYLVVNGVGAAATFVVLLIFIVRKFIHGPWIVVVLIPLLVWMFLRIAHHYAA